MRSLYDTLQTPDARRPRGDAILTEEQYRDTLLGIAPVFREASKRELVPVTIVNDPGVLTSRHINVVDVGAADFGMRGTGGTVDHAEQTTTDVPAYAIHKTVEGRWREVLTSGRAGFDLWMESMKAAAERVAEKENTLIVKGLGAAKGLTNTAGIQTFASAGAWTSAGVAYADIVKAVVDKLGTKKMPQGSAAMVCSPTRMADLYSTFSNTDAAQLEKIRALLPGGVYTSTDLAGDKAYVYARTPTCVEYKVYQDLSVVSLPEVDEDVRARARVIGAMHVKKVDAVVEITSIDV